MVYCISLNGRKVTYTLKRSKRNSIGLSINSKGLVVRIPLRESLYRTESILQNRADWVTRKLDQWESRRATSLTWEIGATFPLLGKPWRLAIPVSGMIKMMPERAKNAADIGQLASLLTAQQIEKLVMAWYCTQAMTCFSERIALYADKLGVSYPILRVSHARTRWGSCSARGVIRLNWRLIQMPLNLVDYVVAHELSHLIEMNHSPAFWRLVKSIYPDYLIARTQLKEYK